MNPESKQLTADRYWIDYARPTALDADHDYQVEIRLSAPHRDVTTVHSFWGNVGLGTPWRHTTQWKNPVALSPDAQTDRRLGALLGSPSCGNGPVQELVVRTFRSISRAWHPRRGTWILDAVADDGTAWCAYSVNDNKHAMLWSPQLMLPQPDQSDD